jgi:hypothetical protein
MQAENIFCFDYPSQSSCILCMGWVDLDPQLLVLVFFSSFDEIPAPSGHVQSATFRSLRRRNAPLPPVGKLKDKATQGV